MSKNPDNQEEKELIHRLGELGLSDKEARVYIALLPLKDAGASAISRQSGLHRQFIYEALERLEALGLARHVVQNGRKKFTAATPNRLVTLVEEKRLSAQAVVKELQERFAGLREQDFEVYQGHNAITAHQYELLRRAPEDSRIDVLSGSVEQFMGMFGEEAEIFEEERVKKNIEVRYLGYESQREALAKMEQGRKLWSYKVLPAKGAGLMNTDIWEDNITLNVLREPYLSFTLTSKEVTAGYREFFEALWSVAKK